MNIRDWRMWCSNSQKYSHDGGIFLVFQVRPFWTEIIDNVVSSNYTEFLIWPKSLRWIQAVFLLPRFRTVLYASYCAYVHVRTVVSLSSRARIWDCRMQLLDNFFCIPSIGWSICFSDARIVSSSLQNSLLSDLSLLRPPSASRYKFHKFSRALYCRDSLLQSQKKNYSLVVTIPSSVFYLPPVVVSCHNELPGTGRPTSTKPSSPDSRSSQAKQKH